MVYAHPGISIEGQMSLMEPNYDPPVEKVFAEATKVISRSTTCLDVLTFIRNQERRPELVYLHTWSRSWVRIEGCSLLTMDALDSRQWRLK